MVINANASDVNATAAITRKYIWGLALDTTQPASRAGLLGNPQASPVAASQGLDLSQSIHGAGGIGGLLACVETQGTETEADDQRYWFFYDAEPLTRRATRRVGACGPRAKPVRRVKGHGNVTQVLDATDTNNITLAAHYEYDPYGNLIASSGTYAAANPIRFSTKWFDAETDMYYFGRRYYLPRLGRWGSEDPIGEVGGVNLYQYVGNKPTTSQDPLGLHSISSSPNLVYYHTDCLSPNGGATYHKHAEIGPFTLLAPPLAEIACSSGGAAGAIEYFCNQRTSCSPDECKADASLLGPLYTAHVNKNKKCFCGWIGNLGSWVGLGRGCCDWCYGIQAALRGRPTKCLKAYCRRVSMVHYSATLEDKQGHRILLDPWASCQPIVK